MMKWDEILFLAIAAVVWVYFFHKAKSKWDFFIGAMIGGLVIALCVLAFL